MPIIGGEGLLKFGAKIGVTISRRGGGKWLLPSPAISSSSSSAAAVAIPPFLFLSLSLRDDE